MELRSPGKSGNPLGRAQEQTIGEVAKRLSGNDFDQALYLATPKF